MNPTPDQIRNINALVTEFDEHWYLDGATKEIKLKPLSFFGTVKNFFWKKHFTVFAMYHWLKHKWVLAEFYRYHFPIGHDNMPTEGFPIKYELLAGWSISKHDLSFLSKGPLTAEGLHTILVHPHIGWQRIFLWAQQLWPVVAGLIAITGAIIRYWEEFCALLQKLG